LLVFQLRSRNPSHAAFRLAPTTKSASCSPSFKTLEGNRTAGLTAGGSWRQIRVRAPAWWC